MTGGIIDVQAVRKSREGREEGPAITLSARVAVSLSADVRVTARPLVGSIADAFDEPRLEIHAEGGTSVILSGLPLPSLLKDSVAFLRDAASGARRDHDFTYGLRAAFDLSTGPFATLEQPAFVVASARTMIHESGSVVLQLMGVPRVRERTEYHVDPKDPEADRRPAFELQLASREAQWLVDELASVLPELGEEDPGPENGGTVSFRP